MKRFGTSLAAGAVMALLIGSCSSGESSDASALGVELSEFKVVLDTESIPAGTITVAARNAGTVEHQLVVFLTDLAVDALPVKDGLVDEAGEGASAIGEIEEFAAGTIETKNFVLAAGSYVLICNLPAHYAGGMRAALTVT